MTTAFIQVTEQNSRRLINISDISEVIEQKEDNMSIQLKNGKTVKIKESFTQIRAMLNNSNFIVRSI
jgi:hypothetical protein